MSKKFKPGELIFTGKHISDLYIVNASGSYVYKLTSGTALLVTDYKDLELPFAKVGDKFINVELDLDCWIPVFYCGLMGWIYYDDINNENFINKNWKYFQALYYFLYSK